MREQNSVIDYSINQSVANFNPVFSNRFFIEVGLPADLLASADTQRLDILCDSVTLPGLKIATNESMNAYKSTPMPYSFVNDELVVSFKAVKDGIEYGLFNQWLEKIVNPETYELAYKNDVVSDWTVYQLDSANQTISAIKLINVFATSISQIDLTSDTADVVKFTVNAIFERRKREY